MVQINWASIRTDYIQGTECNGRHVFPSYRWLAIENRVSYTTVARHGHAENWPSERNQFAIKLRSLRDAKRAEALAEEAAELDRLCLAAAKRQIRIIRAMLADAVEIDKQGRPIFRISPKDLNSLARALRESQEVGRLAIGQPLSADQVRPEESGGVSGLLTAVKR